MAAVHGAAGRVQGMQLTENHYHENNDRRDQEVQHYDRQCGSNESQLKKGSCEKYKKQKENTRHKFIHRCHHQGTGAHQVSGDMISTRQPFLLGSMLFSWPSEVTLVSISMIGRALKSGVLLYTHFSLEKITKLYLTAYKALHLGGCTTILERILRIKVGPVMNTHCLIQTYYFTRER